MASTASCYNPNQYFYYNNVSITVPKNKCLKVKKKICNILM